MCKEMDKELERGKRAAKRMVSHVRRMGAGKATIPCVIDDECWEVTAEQIPYPGFFDYDITSRGFGECGMPGCRAVSHKVNADYCPNCQNILAHRSKKVKPHWWTGDEADELTPINGLTAKGPVMKYPQGWFFWDEAWSAAFGPFATKSEAVKECNRYSSTLSIKGSEVKT